MKALILVDLQNDFTPAAPATPNAGAKPDGALAVPEGNDVLPVVNRLMDHFPLVVATQDWHPPGHRSFASQHEGHDVGEVIEWKGLEQILWPDHCVQGTFGAELLAGLDLSRVQLVIRKGTDPDIDSYSGFFDNGHRKATGLDDELKARHVDELYIAGLATDYCVKWTVLDACKLGYRTTVIADACRGVDLEQGDVDRAWQEMRDAGAEIVESAAVTA